MLACLLSLNGCASLQQKFEDDQTAFARLADKYGTPVDKACAVIMEQTWKDMTAILDEPTPSPAAIANTYKAILINRVQEKGKPELINNCGQFLVEFMIIIGRASGRFK